jgi:hypothetical protein
MTELDKAVGEIKKEILHASVFISVILMVLVFATTFVLGASIGVVQKQIEVTHEYLLKEVLRSGGNITTLQYTAETIAKEVDKIRERQEKTKHLRNP